MGVINAENTLKFKSSRPLFDRVKKYLSSYDSMGLIDDGDFHKYVKEILEALGQAVYRECEAVISVKDFKARLPNNFKFFHVAYRCTFKWNNAPKSINEQKPLFFYTDTEISKECCDSKCTLQCVPENGRTKVVIRTFVNGEDECTGVSNNHRLLILSPNVKEQCTEDCLSIFDDHRHGHLHGHNVQAHDEISFDKNMKHILTRFNEDSIYMQYYGIPVDEDGLPMIPDETHIENAIEYHIYTMLFQEWYWNATVPNIVHVLADARQQYEFHMGMAVSWVKLPSFKRMIQSIRRQRASRKFYYFGNDKTIV